MAIEEPASIGAGVFLVLGSLTAAVAAEVVHVSYHAYEAAKGLGDPTHGGFFVSAVLVGLINCVAMGPAMGLTEWWRQRGTDGLAFRPTRRVNS